MNFSGLLWGLLWHLVVGNTVFFPSPDCPSVYQVAGDGDPMRPFACGACSTATCTRCHLEYHPFSSCKQYKEFKRDPDLSLKEYIKGKEEDVKQCPDCKLTIEKTDGCIHIVCWSCGIHICWGVFRVLRAIITAMHIWR
ncbi:putative transcription factor interactor and regulator CCHC(Zn) family [Helianthus debilis subsp. tardiflorus]